MHVHAWRKMTSSSEKTSVGEVASYILAYLLQNNYKASANAFLRECDVLPSKTLIVLPETPLRVVIAEHNARLNAKVLVNTLGSEPAWQELWGKLHTTLDQIRYLSEELNSHRFLPTARMKAQKVTREKAKKTLNLSVEPFTPSSPHKRKQGPRRKVQYTTSPMSDSTNVAPPSLNPGSDPPNSPTMQQVLDTFLDDVSFPGKLADIINQCVSSDVCGDELSSDMSSETLERILNVTLSEQNLEGVFPSITSQPVEVPLGQSPNMLTEPVTTGDTAVSSTLCDQTSSISKRLRLDDSSSNSEYPSEKDIDNFLDQIHQ